jgi:hypothetical protein
VLTLEYLRTLLLIDGELNLRRIARAATKGSDLIVLGGGGQQSVSVGGVINGGTDDQF